jgi:hypothetical protein
MVFNMFVIIDIGVRKFFAQIGKRKNCIQNVPKVPYFYTHLVYIYKNDVF